MNTQDFARELEGTLEWRIRKAGEYQQDTRNRVAVDELTRFIAEMRMLPHTATVEQWEAFYEILLCDDDKTHAFGIAANEYRSRIGFSAFPESADAYLRELMTFGRVMHAFKDGGGPA